MPAPAQAPIQLDVAALERVGGPIAAGLLPGWRVTWVVLPPDRINALDPELPGPNLAIVKSLPTRRMATVHAVTPWPASESLSETLHHEIGHAWIAPITAQIPDTDASVMLEEQLVETLGVYLASLASSARAAARRALAPIVDSYAPRLRARIWASAGLRARGGQMDPNLVKEALDALESGDSAKCAELLKGLIAAAASGGAAPASEPPPGEGSAAATMPADGGAAPMDPMARPAARKGAIVDSDDIKRARIAREKIEKAVEESEVSGAILRDAAKQQLVAHVRARLPGHGGLPALEKRIMAAGDAGAAKMIADIGIEMAAGEAGGSTRARSGVEHNASPDTTTGAAPSITAQSLIAEGFPVALAQEISDLSRKTPELAQHTLRHARARLHGGDNQYMPGAQTNGAQKAS